MDSTQNSFTFDKENPYSVLACIYDFWQESDEAEKIANFLDEIIKKYCHISSGQGEGGKLLLADLGCGTGQMSLAMNSKGYDVLGIDSSPEMLAEAYLKQTDNKIKFICQDICSLDLFGTVDVMICILDTVNHITTLDKLKSFFKMCKRYLNPGGILIFDIATLKHFEKTLNSYCFSQTGEDYAIIWENSYSTKDNMNNAFITIFTSIDENTYERFETNIFEKYYTQDEIIQIVKEQELFIGSIFGDKKMRAPENADERIFFVVKNKNDPQKEKLQNT